MTLHLYYNETDTYVAESHDDARKQWEEFTGEKIEDYPDDEWTLMADDAPVRIGYSNDEPQTRVPEVFTVEKRGDLTIIIATAAEWAKTGRGFLCTTEY